MIHRISWFVIGLVVACGLLASDAYESSAAKTIKVSDDRPALAGPSGTALPLLRVIRGAGVTGNLKPGARRYPPGTRIQFSFAPTSGHSSAMVVLDGKLIKSRGTLTMNGNHFLWAFGNPESGKTFENVMTVPSDVTMIPYPEFYRKAPSFSFNVADPYCAITSDVIAYPSSYLGDFPLPQINGAPFSREILRGVMFRDFWESEPGGHDPSLNNGCSGAWREAFSVGIRRLEKLGVDHVIVFQTGVLEDLDSDPLRFSDDMRLNDIDLAWMAGQVRSLGLKLHNYLCISVHGSQPLPSNPEPEWAARLIDAWKTFVVGRAVVAQRLGLEALAIDWSAYSWETTAETPKLIAIYVPKMTDLARRVRRIFSGKTILGSACESFLSTDPWSADATLLKSVDWIYCDIRIAVNKSENKQLSIPLLKRNVQSNFEWYSQRIAPIGRPVIWGITEESHRNSLMVPFLEDAFCVPSPEDCSQRRVQTDFSVQGLAYEATLETIKEQTLLQTVAVVPGAYWYVDVIRPKDSFPNLSGSIRNKPAESIVYEWFKR